MSAATVAFTGALVFEFSQEFLSLFQEHLNDQDGEVLPHLFIADVERWLEEQLANSDEVGLDRIREVLDFLEAAFGNAGEEVAELISVSFLEHLPRPGEAGSEIRAMVGPRLTEQLRIIG